MATEKKLTMRVFSREDKIVERASNELGVSKSDVMRGLIYLLGDVCPACRTPRAQPLRALVRDAIKQAREARA